MALTFKIFYVRTTWEINTHGIRFIFTENATKQ